MFALSLVCEDNFRCIRSCSDQNERCVHVIFNFVNYYCAIDYWCRFRRKFFHIVSEIIEVLLFSTPGGSGIVSFVDCT